MISKTEEWELEGEVNICHNIKIVNIHSLFFYIINPCTILIHVHTITKIEARVVLGMTVQICHKNHELVCHPLVILVGSGARIQRLQSQFPAPWVCGLWSLMR